MFHPSGSPPSPGERSAQEETIEVPRVEEGVEFGLDVSALTFHPNRTLSEEFSGDSTDAHSDSSNDDFYASGRHKARGGEIFRFKQDLVLISAGMQHGEKVSTGSLREKLIVRSSSRRSVRNTISRALKSTFGIGDKHEEKESSKESLPTTSSIQPSSSSEGSGSYFTQQSSGFCSMTHLPPVQRKKPPELPTSMTQSMYEPRSSSRTPSTPRRGSQGNYYHQDYDDFDDTVSVISSASTSRIITHPRRVKKHSLNTFLLSPVRLRRREVTNIDAIEAGFEPASAVPRCYSTNSLSFNGSQFQPRSLSCSQDVCHQECAQTPIRNPRISSLAGYSQDPTPRSISTSDFRLGGDYGRGSSGDDDCFTKISASENRLANMNSSPNTPRRRSLVHTTAPHTPQGYGRDMRQPVSSSRKVAVAPTPQRIDPGTSNRVATHHVAPMQRKSSSGGGNERMVDGSLRGRDDEVSGLNQRVKHLERELSRLYKNQPSSSGSPAYPHQYASPAARDPCHCGTHLEIVLAEKNHKIDSLTSKVEQLTDQLRREQQKVEDLKRERINSRMELDGVVRKLDQLNNRYLEYDKALEEKYAKLEEEYNRLKQEYAEKDHILGEIQSEIAQNEQTTVFVSSQNDRLQTLLDVREREVRELTNELRQLQMNVYEKEKKISDQNSVIMAMSAEASSHVSTSSGSVPLGGDDYDEPSFGRSHRQYTKANSTLGILNNGPVSTNLRKSLSNFALNVAKTDTVTPAMSKDMRECRAVIAECRVLNVGLKDALKCLQGRDARGIPQVLLAMQRHDETDFGNSDDDSSTAVDSRTMSVADAETYVGKTLRCLRDLEGDLETMRNTTMTLMQTAQDSPLF